jgi:hypothetical protein
VHHLEAGASPEAVLEAAWRQLHAVRPDRFHADVI